jgi:hypothetical protein
MPQASALRAKVVNPDGLNGACTRKKKKAWREVHAKPFSL